MNVATLLERLLERFPADTAESWDHIGLSVGDPAQEVGRIAVALDPTLANVEAAAAMGANVLLTHHPVYIKAPASFEPAPSATNVACSSAVFAAARLGVSVISLHTNLDRSREARAHLATLAGVTPEGSLEHPDDDTLAGLGAVGTLEPCALETLAQRCATAFGTTPRVWGDPAQQIERAAVLGGSLGDLGELALAAGAQVVVTGEAGYHVCQDLALRGCSVVLLGHDRSEQPFVDILSVAAESAGIEAASIATMDCPRQWWTTNEGVRS
ncbi:Nif3-like dinuclear metal center hexameric protein [Collinsella sp. An2]|uniref:Nif3-like dinuclear metal center hexameric protein n=1 Tax=Collinsella sp. An2 TaxID=1965585 RepID=UPI000B3780F3|nr:Nif3-like dinuclear metal center hexameric protein [Collinsella sp. An2]OUP08209.1 hypothetical protein B5F33_07250 [Collinsella sp. An2]